MLSPKQLSEALQEQVNRFENERLEKDQELNIPVKTDGTTFELNDLKGCQEQIMTYIFKRFFEWINRTPQKKKNTSRMSETEVQRYEYNHCKLTRMTITGAGGTGKSVLIKTLITTI